MPGIVPQFLQSGAAVCSKSDDLFDVAARPRRCALAQERKAPQPLSRIGTQAEQRSRILAREPTKYLGACGWISPGLGMTCRYLPTIRETGFCGNRGLAIHNRDIASKLVQAIGTCNTHDSGAKHNDLHGQPQTGIQRRVSLPDTCAAPSVLGPESFCVAIASHALLLRRTRPPSTGRSSNGYKPDCSTGT
jgi:hypothetical protein